MSSTTIIWSMVSSACLTLAAIHALTWFMNRKASVDLFASLAAMAAAAFAFCELRVMQQETPADFATAVRWAHVPGRLVLLSLLGFVWVYLRPGKRWLAWTVCGITLFALLLNFITGQNLNYREIVSLRHIPFLGDTVTVAEAVTNPWVLVGQLNMALLLVLVAGAGVVAWRRGERRQAVMAGSIALFLLAATAQSVLVFWGFVQMPYTASPFYLGVVAVMGYGLGRDTLRASQLVGELRASEAELRESEERLRLAAEAAHLGIWIRDLTRNDIWATDSWRALFGFSKSEPLDLDVMLGRLHADDRDMVEQTLLRVREGSGSYEIEYRVALPDGNVRWIASRGKVLRDSDGAPVLVRGVSLDMTKQKQSERETHVLRQELAHVGRVSMMGQLASALAHEINQPLSAILRNAEAAELFMQHASPDLDEVRAILADIIKNERRAGAVIDKMRALLKRRELEAVPLDVSELVSEVVALVRPDVVTRRVSLEVHLPRDLCPVRCDRVHVQQVLLNLVLNGMDAVDGVKQEDRRVTVSARHDGAHFIELAVSDAGPGIPVDSLAHVFEPFFTTKPNGMGMGLPISRTIVEAHGGRLWAENNHGGGATFRFTLPIAEEAGN